jgi:hypothetical protein
VTESFFSALKRGIFKDTLLENRAVVWQANFESTLVYHNQILPHGCAGLSRWQFMTADRISNSAAPHLH